MDVPKEVGPMINKCETIVNHVGALRNASGGGKRLVTLVMDEITTSQHYSNTSGNTHKLKNVYSKKNGTAKADVSCRCQVVRAIM